MSIKHVFAFVAVSSSLIACGSSTPPPETEGSAAKAAEPATAATVPTSAAPASASAAPAPTSAAGKTCTRSADCEKGEVCSGEPGCDKTWTCQPSRPCTKDLVQYCGCDGKTFSSSGSCPGAKHSKKGACE